MNEVAEPKLPPRVARSEDELLRLARGLVSPGHRPLPRAPAAHAITRIGPTAMGLLQQTLARGLTSTLLRRGGWETRRTLVDGRPRRGRLWERHRELPPLRFGPASFTLLVWLHGEDLVRPSQPLIRQPETTLADDLLHYLAVEQLVRAGFDPRQDAFCRSPLCQLGFADALASDGPEPLQNPLPTVDFRPLAEGPGAIAVEALQIELAARWLEMERRKGSIVALDDMVDLGRAQAQVLDGWFSALDRVEPRRRELATFVAEAARGLLARGPRRRCPDYRWWIRSLSVEAPLAARQAAFTAAAAFLRGVARLGRWLDEAGVIAHFDEDYEAAQLLLSSWQYLRARPEPPPEASRERELVEEGPPLPASILDRAWALASSLESLHSLGVAD